MTHLDIQTQVNKDGGSIEMRPQLDKESLEVIHDLGITGICSIVERDDYDGESLAFIFNYAKKTELDKTTQSIAEALSQTGCKVSFSEKSQLIRESAQPKHWSSRIIKRVRAELALTA